MYDALITEFLGLQAITTQVLNELRTFREENTQLHDITRGLTDRIQGRLQQ